MRITRLCTLCSVSKVLGPLANGSLSVSVLLPSNTFGNPKDTQGNGSSIASVQGPLWGWGQGAPNIWGPNLLQKHFASAPLN